MIKGNLIPNVMDPLLPITLYSIYVSQVANHSNEGQDSEIHRRGGREEEEIQGKVSVSGQSTTATAHRKPT